MSVDGITGPFARLLRIVYYLGIDQHIGEVHLSLRDAHGDIQRTEKVSTHTKKIKPFFQSLTNELLPTGATFLALLEVFEFNGWLIRMLQDYGCQQVVVIRPLEGKKTFVNRRDADQLSELLWVYRDHLLAGKPILNVRQVDLRSTIESESQKLNRLRMQNIQARTETANRIKHLLYSHNLQWELPTSSFPSKAAITWLNQVELPLIDRFELDYLLADLQYLKHRLAGIEKEIAARTSESSRREFSSRE